MVAGLAMLFGTDCGLLGGDAIEFGFAGNFFSHGASECDSPGGVERTSAFDHGVVREPDRLGFLEIRSTGPADEATPFIKAN